MIQTKPLLKFFQMVPLMGEFFSYAPCLCKTALQLSCQNGNSQGLVWCYMSHVCLFVFFGRNSFSSDSWNSRENQHKSTISNNWLKEHDFFNKQLCKAFIFGGCYPPVIFKPLIFRGKLAVSFFQREYHPTYCCFTEDPLLAHTLLATLQGGAPTKLE